MAAAAHHLRCGHVRLIALGIVTAVRDAAGVEGKEDQIGLPVHGAGDGHGGGTHLRPRRDDDGIGIFGIGSHPAVGDGDSQVVGGKVFDGALMVAVVEVEAGEILILDVRELDDHALGHVDTHHGGAQGPEGVIHIDGVGHQQVEFLRARLDGIDVLVDGGVTQSPVLALAPSPDGAVGLDSQGVGGAGGHGADRTEGVLGGAAQAAEDLDGRSAVGGSCGSVVRGGDAQLAALVATPGVESAILGQSEAAVGPGGYGSDDLLVPGLAGAAQAVGAGHLAILGVTQDPDGQGAVVGAPVAQLAVGIVAHGVDLGTDAPAGALLEDGLVLDAHQYQGVGLASRDAHGMLHEAARALALALEHLHGQATVVRGADTKLSVGVETPGEHGAVGAQGHGVVAARGDGDDAVEVVAVGGALALEDLGGDRHVGGDAVALAQLAVAVGAEGVHLAAQAGSAGQAGHGLGGLGAAGEQEGVVAAGGGGHHELAREGGDLSGVVVALGPAQLAAAVVTGGPDPSIGIHHDQVTAAGGDGDDAGEVLPLAGGGGHLDLGGLGAGDGGAVAQLAIGIVAPGPDGAVGPEGGGETVTHSHHGHSDAHRISVVPLLRHGELDRPGVVGGSIGEPDHCGAHSGAGNDGGTAGGGGGGGDGGYALVGGDPPEAVRIGDIGVAHREGAAVNEQVKSGEVGLQQVVATGVVLDGEGVPLLHGDVHGGQEDAVSETVGVQGIGALDGAVLSLDHGLVDHQGAGLHVAHLDALGGDVASGHIVGAHDVIRVVAPGVDEAVGPDHDHPVGGGREGQHALELRGGVGVEGIALEDRGGLVDARDAGGGVVIHAHPGVGAGAQLTLAVDTPAVSQAGGGDSDDIVVAHMDACHVGKTLHQLNLAGEAAPGVDLSAADGGEGLPGRDVRHAGETVHHRGRSGGAGAALVNQPVSGAYQVGALGRYGQLLHGEPRQGGGDSGGAGDHGEGTIIGEDQVLGAVGGDMGHAGIAHLHQVELVAAHIAARAVERTVGAEDQGKAVAGQNLDHGGEIAAQSNAGGILLEGGVAQAQLAHGVKTPAPDTAVLAEGHSVGGAGGDHRLVGEVTVGESDPDLAAGHHFPVLLVSDGENDRPGLGGIGRGEGIASGTLHQAADALIVHGDRHVGALCGGEGGHLIIGVEVEALGVEAGHLAGVQHQGLVDGEGEVVGHRAAGTVAVGLGAAALPVHLGPGGPDGVVGGGAGLDGPGGSGRVAAVAQFAVLVGAHYKHGAVGLVEHGVAASGVGSHHVLDIVGQVAHGQHGVIDPHRLQALVGLQLLLAGVVILAQLATLVEAPGPNLAGAVGGGAQDQGGVGSAGGERIDVLQGGACAGHIGRTLDCGGSGSGAVVAQAGEQSLVLRGLVKRVGSAGGHREHLLEVTVVAERAGLTGGGEVGIAGGMLGVLAAGTAVAVAAPGGHGAVLPDGQGVIVPGHDVDDVPQSPAGGVERDAAALAHSGGGGARLDQDGQRDAAGGIGQVAALTLGVVAPHVDVALVGQGQGEVTPGGQSRDALQGHGRRAGGAGVVLPGGGRTGHGGGEEHLGGVGVGGVAGLAAAQLTAGIGAPGPDGAVALQGQAESRPGGDGGDVGKRGTLAGHDLDRSGAAGGLAVTQLTVVVPAPGPDGAVALEGQGEVVTAGNLGRSHLPGVVLKDGDVDHAVLGHTAGKVVAHGFDENVGLSISAGDGRDGDGIPGHSGLGHVLVAGIGVKGGGEDLDAAVLAHLLVIEAETGGIGQSGQAQIHSEALTLPEGHIGDLALLGHRALVLRGAGNG